MATYGDFPGVRVSTAGGSITGVQLGAEETLVIFGEGDPSSGSASVNSPSQIGARQEANTKFGEDTELANAMREATANGANLSYLYGVMVATESASHSTTPSGTGTLDNAPIVEDLSIIDVVEDPGGANTDVSVEFRYEDSLSTPTESDTMFINPFTGDFAADDSAVDYDISYEYQDWTSAFDAADGLISEDDTGIYLALSEAETVASDLSGKVTSLRNNYQLVSGIAGAQPNATTDDGVADFDTANYSDAVDSDTQFLTAPVRREGTSQTVLGGVGGLFAGNPINDPVYNEQLSGYTSLEQVLSKAEADELRDTQVIPIRQSGSIRVRDNLSTSTDEDWQRDFWRRRIVDRVILIAKQVGDQTIGRINDENTRSAAQRTIRTQLENMANDRLIKSNTSEVENWYVEVYQSTTNPDRVSIDIGVTPQGIVKQVDASVTIQT